MLTHITRTHFYPIGVIHSLTHFLDCLKCVVMIFVPQSTDTQDAVLAALDLDDIFWLAKSEKKIKNILRILFSYYQN